MRILVISDTHGVCDRVYEVYRKLTKQNPVDYIVHCGDYCKDAEEIRMRLGVPVASVRGNCDGGFADTDFSILETEAGNFLITHGHMQNVDLSMQNLYYKALENDCVGALFGHTHRAVYTQTGDVPRQPLPSARRLRRHLRPADHRRRRCMGQDLCI